MRDIDTFLSRSAVAEDLLSRRQHKTNVTLSAWMRRAGIVLAAAGLFSAAAGCAADTGGTTLKSDGSGQTRYYGGPKSPMWRDVQ